MNLRIASMLGGWTLAIFLAAACGNHAASAERTFSVAEVRAEFDELYERLRASHYDLYARRARSDYDTLFRSMRKSFDRPMTASDIQIQFQKFAAYGNIAHANIAFPMRAYHAYRDAGGKAFPLGFRVVKGAVYITENDSGLDSLSPGDEIVALDGKPMKVWLDRLEAHISADNDYLAHTQLEYWLPALFWLELGPQKQFELDIRSANGAVSRVVLPALTQAEMKANAKKKVKTLALDWDKREFRMLDNGVAYLRPGPFYNNEPDAANQWDVSKFSLFLDQAFQSFIHADAKTLVIDLRTNPGGDNSFSDLMVGWFANKPFRFTSDFRVRVSQAAIDANRKRLNNDAADKNTLGKSTPDKSTPDKSTISHKYAEAYKKHKLGEVFSFEIPLSHPREGARFGGKVFLLIDRHSYSNTVTVAALSQDYGFATILGEETSDLATSYGASESFELSRSAVTVTFPKAYLVRPSGSKVARGVVPDIAIETPIVQPVGDVVLKRAIRIAVEAGH